MGLEENNQQGHVVSFGKANMLQASMLLLAGYLPVDSVGIEPVKIERRLDLMQKGLKTLVKKTGFDFGYDVAKWNAVLLADDNFAGEYTAPYAWEFVCKKIEDCSAIRDREKLMQLLADRQGENPSCNQ